mmetsp:Transcript_19154/g.24850  ORF Transcript_19154/g.24850 Transcript_19154/m.24850 type:complete len:92 (-) Transcript_19154:341-616(-)|eukprot:CAMPEP_0197290990 /NCGR_PEP_ID=MMETSP0890-20130614/10468_1 /TAXON_ID=44058 ORGANISM="Aureoumbra lagunensis, Strain CCMP1510" /NCGR_SAMPLE_ID=MMETSP0890 /ASSEMBLY_ACC=CAM_ASM_000533 /LENGTH=91 /DNA_ID=CAMNT_0042763415 /DNA_START=61 /DNA_END=336 /DNA_ORIENTATION=+
MTHGEQADGYRYIVSTEGHDDDPDYDSYVLWATASFLLAILFLGCTYVACYYCKGIQPGNSEIGPYPLLEPLCCPLEKKKDDDLGVQIEEA